MKNNYKLDFLAIFESRISANMAAKVINSHGLDNSFREDAVGLSKGIWLLWNNCLIFK